MTSNFNDEFWDYSIDDILKYDLKCQIETMFNVSGKKKFAYVGQSQGIFELTKFFYFLRWNSNNGIFESLSRIFRKYIIFNNGCTCYLY